MGSDHLTKICLTSCPPCSSALHILPLNKYECQLKYSVDRTPWIRSFYLRQFSKESFITNSLELFILFSFFHLFFSNVHPPFPDICISIQRKDKGKHWKSLVISMDHGLNQIISVSFENKTGIMKIILWCCFYIDVVSVCWAWSPIIMKNEIA